MFGVRKSMTSKRLLSRIVAPAILLKDVRIPERPAYASREWQLPDAPVDTPRPTQKEPARPDDISAPVKSKHNLASKSPQRLEQLSAFTAFAVLLGTTAFWSILSARLQYGNADQLVDSYLFSDAKTFEGAQFPATHSFLLKWPIFALGAGLGNTKMVFTVLTVAITLLTAGAFSYVLFRLVRSLRTWALLVLALSLVLLLVPAQSAAGSLLPVNWAMLTTRNIEYILYFFAIALTLRTHKLVSWPSFGAVLSWAVLFLSDRLFVPLAVGAFGLVLLGGMLLRRTELRQTASRGLAQIALGFGLALLGTMLLQQITQFGHVDTASPYAIASPKQMALGACYAALGLLTNLGLNAAPAVHVLSEWPRAALLNMRGVAGVAYMVVALGAFTVVSSAIRRVWSARKRAIRRPLWRYEQFALLLFCTLLTALSVFILTDHYYAGDARYLAVAPFALFSGAAVVMRGRHISGRAMLIWGSLLMGAIVAAVSVSYRNYQASVAAGQQYTEKNERIVQVLAQHKVKRLVGDYWRVLPVRALSDGTQSVLPLQSCSEPRTVLTSHAWRLRPHESFAYLLSLEKGATDFPTCTLADVLRHYGRPNGSFIVEGSVTKPKEMLLFYDHGLPKSVAKNTDASTPVPLAKLSFTDCTEGTILQIVAHPDDDLLFMNPALLQSVDTGMCIRTLYLTAGDNGGGAYYWIERQLGVEAAYSTMSRRHAVWQSQSIKLGDTQYATVSNMRGNDKIALIFLNLPDGNTHGNGFAGTDYASLQKLNAGVVPSVVSIDTQSVYTRADIESVLGQLMMAFRPTEVRYLTPEAGVDISDHSDHAAVGWLVRDFLGRYQSAAFTPPLRTEYVGYPQQSLAENVSGELLSRKEASFMAYAKHDNGVCQTLDICYAQTTYGKYLPRQYTLTEYRSYFASPESVPEEQ